MSDTIYCCKLVDSGNPEVLPELLTAMGYDYSTWVDREGGSSYHTLYFDRESLCRLAVEAIEQQLDSWQALGIKVSEVESLAIEREDWAEVWKRYFNIIHISPRLVVKPSWLDYTSEPGQVVVEIDPGMSFGTGQHATTAFCLKMLDKLADKQDVDTVLDAGCGSGILSIAAAKLGYGVIDGFDIDADAVRIAEENLIDNAIAPAVVNLQTAALESFISRRSGYDLVLANILAHILKANSSRIVTLVKPGGYLVLAGILTQEYDDLKQLFTSQGVEEIENFTEREWTSGLFRRCGKTVVL